MDHNNSRLLITHDIAIVEEEIITKRVKGIIVVGIYTYVTKQKVYLLFIFNFDFEFVFLLIFKSGLI